MSAASDVSGAWSMGFVSPNENTMICTGHPIEPHFVQEDIYDKYIIPLNAISPKTGHPIARRTCQMLA
jgi:hypothetical protein